jgi:amino acid adenylation domain-containing protein
MTDPRGKDMDPGIPLTRSQALIRAGQMLAPASPLYNSGWRFDFGAPVDPDLFARAFAAVAGASDAMRAVFPGHEDVQRIGPAPALAPTVDLSAQPDPDAAADAWIAARMGRVFDLSRGTTDAALIRLGPDRHAFFLNQHHIATDAQSAVLFMQALSGAYERLRAGADPAPTLPAFADFARREAAERDGPALAAARAHWDGLVEGHVPGSPPYGGRRDGQGLSRRVDMGLTPDLSDGIMALADHQGFRALSRNLAVFGILATAQAAFLHRVTGDRAVTLGAPAHNRGTLALRETIGLFIEMFPLRIAIEEGDSFASLHARAMAGIAAWMRHARPGASGAASASLFNAVLNVITARFGAFAGAPLRASWLDTDAQDPRHDMRLHLHDYAGSGHLQATADLDRAVFGDALAGRVPGHFRALLGAFLDNPDRRIAEVGLAGPDEAAAIAARHDGPAEAPGIETVLALFARQVATRPDAPAVTEGTHGLTYAALDAASDRVAGGLVAAGVRAGDAVILHAARSAGLVAAIIGILKAGAHLVPLGADTPPERLAAIAMRLRPACILTDPAREAAALATCAPVLPLTAGGDAELPAPPDPDALAYVIYTSGSTGEPKGVAVDHAGLARYADWAARSFGGGPSPDYPLFSAIGFDLTITSIVVPLVTGGGIRVYPETPGGPDLAILDVLRDDAVDVVKLTPAHLAIACEAGAALRRVAALVLGGETLTTALARRALDRLGGHLAVFNEYGPTEAVVGCMIHRFDPAMDRGAAVPVGRPADGVAIRILDGGLNPVPDGVAGEIFIGGRLARGYLGRPDLTAERFLPDPFAPGALMYRSGDIGRVLPSGDIDCLGRADDQVKIGGVRIEPAEIEAAIESFPGILRAHVAPLDRAGRGTGRSCRLCGLPDSFPGLTIDADGTCAICADFARIRDRAQGWFSTPDALRAKLADARARRTGRYDAIMLLSGGKDSTYALYRLAEITPDILALTLDNGFISDGAKENIRRVTADLGIEHRFMSTPAMNAVFVDSLKRFSNVCQGCFKVIYTLGLREALAEGVPAIVTGLSRGQFFETRLTPELFADGAPDPAEIDRMVLEARKSYHRMDDAVARLLDTADIRDDAVFERVEFIDFYRHVDVPVEEIYRLLRERAPWIRPGDTGRSTNCLINDLGIWVHRRREGFHNYALPYSWDVRLGHKTRDEALAELDDEIDPQKVRGILHAIGADETLLQPRAEGVLAAWVAADGPVDMGALRAHLARLLPRAMVPARLAQVPQIPLTPNGKVDRARLPVPAPQGDRAPGTPPRDPVEARLLDIWRTVLGDAAIGVEDDFYAIGGESIAAIRIAADAGREGLAISAIDIFECQTVAALARRAGLAAPSGPLPDDEPLLDLGAEDMAALSRALGRDGAGSAR